jgi:phospholipase/carboxylesterase
MVPLVPKSMPDLAGKKILIIAGTADPMGSPKQIAQLYALLQKSGADVQREAVPTGHGLSQEDLQLAHDWLEKM